MKNVPDKSARENQNTVFTLFLCVDNRALYGIMWMNIVKPAPSTVFMLFHFVLKFLLYASLLLIFIRPAQSAINHFDAPSSFLSDFEFIPCVQNGGPLLEARINSVAM
jgi:hypothetical protein